MLLWKKGTRDRVPLYWAAIQNNLGIVLFAILLVRREGGTDLGRRQRSTPFTLPWRNDTRERIPLDWAATQNNLGNTLFRDLGARESGTAKAGGSG